MATLAPEVARMRTTTDPNLTPLERKILTDLASGLGYSEAGGDDGRNRRGVAHRMRERLGARTNAHAVAVAYQRGLLEPCPPASWGLLAMMAVRYAAQRPRMAGLVVQVIREYPRPPMRVAADMAETARTALASGDLDWEEGEHFRDLLAYLDGVIGEELPR